MANGNDDDATCGSVKKFTIEMVNPKFKEYNKPFFLAVVVGALTAFITLGLFIRSELTCPLTYSTLSKESDGSTFLASCKNNCVFQSLKAQAVGDNDWVESRKCFSESLNYCPESASDYVIPPEERVECFAEKTLPFVTLSCSVCPDTVTSLGAALGYAGLIELIATIIIVAVCKQAGVLKGGPEGHMGKMICEVVENVAEEYGLDLEMPECDEDDADDTDGKPSKPKRKAGSKKQKGKAKAKSKAVLKVQDYPDEADAESVPVVPVVKAVVR